MGSPFLRSNINAFGLASLVLVSATVSCFELDNRRVSVEQASGASGGTGARGGTGGAQAGTGGSNTGGTAAETASGASAGMPGATGGAGGSTGGADANGGTAGSQAGSDDTGGTSGTGGTGGNMTTMCVGPKDELPIDGSHWMTREFWCSDRAEER